MRLPQPLELYKHPILRKIFTNIGWLFLDKLLRMGVGLVVVIWLARYFGPEQFGQLNFAIALVSVFGVFAALGLRGIVVRDLIEQPQHCNTTLGTAFILKFTAAVSTYILLIVTISIVEPDDVFLKSLIAILGLSIIFKSTEVVNFWFESQVDSKYVVWVESSTFFAASVVKLLMLWQQASLIMFVWAMLIETIVVGLALFFVYAKVVSDPLQWKATRLKAKSLLADGWPLIISSAAWIIYTRTDQIMIGEMLNDQAVGYYSVAIRISDIATFISTIIALSIIPTLIPLRKTNTALYHHRYQMTYDIVVGLMLLTAICTALLSGLFIKLLFGEPYADAASVLSIHIWSAIFIAMATVSGKYLINEGLQKITMQRHVMGVFINIPLNFLVIPVYGIDGAAFSSLVSLALSNYVFDAVTPITRTCFIQKTRSFVAYGLIRNILNKGVS